MSKNQGGDSSDHSGNTAGETNTPGNANQSGSDINAGGNDANAGGSDTNAGGSDANAGGNDANAGGSDANAGGSGGDSSSGSGQAAAESLLHASETKVISREIGWVKYVAISFKSGSLEDYEVFIDGTDISAALTKVDSAGKIVKWMSTVKDPKELRVVRKSDGQQEVLALGEGAASTGPEAGNPEDAPKYVFTNGPISRFDYFLDHYDQNGEVRTLPSGTTFDLEAVSDQNAGEGNLPGRYYSPDTLIDERGNGKLLIKLSLANEEQSRWFDNLERIKALNDENRPVNDNINFTKRIETVHGKTGVIEVALPQTNFFNRGRYSFVLYSAANKAITIPVHLVDKNKFELLLNSSTPSPRTGDKIMFNIVSADTSIDPTFGNDLKNPIRRVLLVKPSGEKLELEKIKHWALIGDLFNIYGSDPEKKEILTDEPGIYTIRIYADGYQSIEKKIEIARGDITAGEGTNSFAAVSAVSLLNGVDALSSASGNIGDGGSDGGSSGGGIGGSINGYYLFEHDLLINAHILNDIRPGNPQVKAVLDRYFSHVPVMAGDSFAKLYDFNRYLGAVRDKRLEGQEMSFVQYLAADGGKIAKTKPREYRYVLEDGLLGSLQKFSEALGKDFPVLEGRRAKKGESFTLKTDDTEYVSAIKALYMDGNSLALRNDNYLKQFNISAAKDAIIIYPSAFNQYNTKLIGEHTLRIDAEGYKVNYLKLTITKDYEEFNLRLADNPMKAQDDEPTKYYTDQDVHIHAAGQEGSPLYGDFLKSLSEVRLDTPDASLRHVTAEGEGGLFTNDNYKKSQGELILQGGLFKKEGSYTLHLISGGGYPNKTLQFEISKPLQQPEEGGENETELKLPPRFLNAEYKSTLLDKYWLVKFEAENDKAIEDYFNTAVNKVTVNERVYQKTAFGDGNHYTFGEAGAYGSLPHLKLYDKSFVQGQNRIRIEAEGYEALEFIITSEAQGEQPGDSADDPGSSPSLKKPPQFASQEYKKSFLNNYWLVKFNAENDKAIEDYFNTAVNKVRVNETVYQKTAFGDGNHYTFGETGAYGTLPYLKLYDKSFVQGQNKIRIEAEGYEVLEFVIINGSEDSLPPESGDPGQGDHAGGGEATEGDLLATPKVKEVVRLNKMFFGTFYVVVFKDMEKGEIQSYLEAAKITVNGSVFSRKYLLNEDDRNAYKLTNEDEKGMNSGGGAYKYLVFPTGSLQRGQNNVKIEHEGYQLLGFNFEKRR